MEDTFDIRSEQVGLHSDKEYENALRPLSFDDFNGQTKVVDNLKVFVVRNIVASRLTIRFCMDLRAWAKLP